MSTIKLVPVSVNGRPICFPPICINTCPHGSDREEVENRVEDCLIRQIDRRVITWTTSNR